MILFKNDCSNEADADLSVNYSKAPTLSLAPRGILCDCGVICPQSR